MVDYTATFKTTDEDIVAIMPNEQVTEFYYDKQTGNGRCHLKRGISSLDLMSIAKIALDHQSYFYIKVLHAKSGIEQEWELKDGKSTVVSA